MFCDKDEENDSIWTESTGSDKDKPFFQRRRDLYQQDDRLAWTGFENTDKKLVLVSSKRPKFPAIDPDELNRAIESDSDSSEYYKTEDEIINGKNKINETSNEKSKTNYLQQSSDEKDKSSDVLHGDPVDFNPENGYQKKTSDNLRKEKKIPESSQRTRDDCSNCHKEKISETPARVEKTKFQCEKDKNDCHFEWEDLKLDLSPLMNSTPRCSENKLVSKEHENKEINQNNRSKLTYDIKSCRSNREESVNDQDKKKFEEVISEFFNDPTIYERLLYYVNEVNNDDENAMKNSALLHLKTIYEKSQNLNDCLTKILGEMKKITDILKSSGCIDNNFILAKISDIEKSLVNLAFENYSETPQDENKNILKIDLKMNNHTGGLLAEICQELKWFDIRQCNEKSPSSSNNKTLESKQQQSSEGPPGQEKVDSRVIPMSVPHFAVYPVDETESSNVDETSSQEFTISTQKNKPKAAEELSSRGKIQKQQNKRKKLELNRNQFGGSKEENKMSHLSTTQGLPNSEVNEEIVSCNECEQHQACLGLRNLDNFKVKLRQQSTITNAITNEINPRENQKHDVNNSISVHIKLKNDSSNTDTKNCINNEITQLERDKIKVEPMIRNINSKRMKSRKSKLFQPGSTRKRNNNYNNFGRLKYDWLQSESDEGVKQKVTEIARLEREKYKKIEDDLAAQRAQRINKISSQFRRTKPSQSHLQWLQQQTASEAESSVYTKSREKSPRVGLEYTLNKKLWNLCRGSMKQ